MAEIKKKTWPEYFQKILDGKKNVDIRLADFDVNEGDTLVLEEYNPETKKYTGRVLKKKIKNINKVNMMDFSSAENIKKYGHYILEME
jgi:ribosomal protein S17